MAEDIGEGGGVPGGGGAPFVARGWPAAGARTPSDARAPPPPLLRLLLLRRSGGELAPPRSRTVTALPSNAKERERITGLPRAAAEAGTGARSLPRAAAAAAAAQDLTFHPGPAAAARSGSARALSPAPCRPRH